MQNRVSVGNTIDFNTLMLNSLIVIQASPLRQHSRMLRLASSNQNKSVANAAMKKYEFLQYSI
jgi:hypothetical protein